MRVLFFFLLKTHIHFIALHKFARALLPGGKQENSIICTVGCLNFFALHNIRCGIYSIMLAEEQKLHKVSASLWVYRFLFGSLGPYTY